jgi:LPS export ABC transporter protein LptC
MKNASRGNARVRTAVLPWAVLVVAAAAGIVGCGQQADPQPAAPRREGAVPEQQFFDYRLIESRAGVRQWVLQSHEMQKFADQDDVVLVAVTMDFHRDGAHFSTLTSDSGRANLQTRNVHTWGNVVVVTDDGKRLETEELFFDNTTQKITNDVFNRITDQGDVVTGIGLETDPDLEYIELKRDVQAEVGDDNDTRGERP